MSGTGAAARGRALRIAGKVALLGGAVVATGAAAAPDELALGKAEGYPLCPPSLTIETRCLVAFVSRRDEVSPARTVARGAQTRPLGRAVAEPAVSYRWRAQEHGLDDYLARNRTTGLLILRGDTILAERYQYERTAAHRMTSMSMAKTVVAMLVGIALHEGRLRSVDDVAAKYVPELEGTPYGETAIRHLLTMSSGVRFVEAYTGSDDVATLARLALLGESEGGAATVLPFRIRERPAGERFHYASSETQVLGLVLRAATGKPLAEYLSEKIWGPMGAEADASWLVDKGGYEAAFTGLNATVRDYGRFGLLLANGGAWNGRQIVPAEWVHAATTPSAPQFRPRRTHAPAGNVYQIFGYGYQTWVLPGEKGQFALRGLRRQAVFVDPKSQVVLVHTAAGSLGEGWSELLALWSGVLQAASR
jgi:CubicO group peptidase (beta-lactamase class C family)